MGLQVPSAALELHDDTRHSRGTSHVGTKEEVRSVQLSHRTHVKSGDYPSQSTSLPTEFSDNHRAQSGSLSIGECY